MNEGGAAIPEGEATEVVVHHLFVDVGQGDLSFIVPPGGDAIMVDCNDSAVALSLIRDLGLRLTRIVCTHTDQDHIRGVEDVISATLEEQRHGELMVYVPIDRELSGMKDHVRRFYTFLADRRGQRALRLENTLRDAVELAQGPNWSVSLPRRLLTQRLRELSGERVTYARAEPNRLSSIVLSRVGDRCVYIGGDAEEEAWGELAREHQQGHSTHVLRAPHHGAARNLDPGQLYEDFQPDHAVISVGTNNRWEHPTGEHVWAATSVGCQVMCTQRTSQCDPELDGSLVAPSLFPAHRQTTHPSERRCAGTVYVGLGADAVHVAPKRSEHRGFIARFADRLCAPQEEWREEA